jgi:hypothetical protein
MRPERDPAFGAIFNRCELCKMIKITAEGRMTCQSEARMICGNYKFWVKLNS